MIRLGLVLSFGTLALLSGTTLEQSSQRRFEDQERALGGLVQQLAAERGERSALEQRLAALHLEHGLLKQQLEASGAEVGLTEASLAELRGQLAAGQQRYEALVEGRVLLGPEELESRFLEVDRRLAAQNQELLGLLDQALGIARAGEAEAEAARRTAEALAREAAERAARERGPEQLWEALMGPVVQLNGQASVGSGVLLESVPHPDGQGFRTFLLTAWHVVRDMQQDPLDPRDPVPTRIYAPDGSVREESARVLCFRADLDAALCELSTREPQPFGARLASRERILAARTFEPIYAVGCPLGTDPIPTAGQIAAPNHRVDGQHYWMINAPTYIGNSGGGIFDGQTLQLIGLFSKIYNHGSVRPTIVPHMGLVTPLAAVLDWLEEQGYRRDEAGLLSEVLRVRLSSDAALPAPSGVR